MSFKMKSTEETPGIASFPEEIRKISIISALALLLFGFSVVLDGPVTSLAWILTAAGLLCLVYIVVASRSLLNHSQQKQSSSRKADTQ